jgi:uncharacterized membrane protein YhaH (DUF805 family)
MNMQTSFFRPTAEGRVNRTTFIAYIFLYSLAVMAIALLVWNSWSDIGLFLNPAISVAWIVYSFSIAIRRAHDIGRSGWFALLLFVPVANLILFFWPGSDGENDYGQQPQQSHVGLKVVAVASFAPFFFGLLFVLPHDKSADVWQAYCNILEHREWNKTTFPNSEKCWEESNTHLDEYPGEKTRTGEGHSVGCKLVKTSFPMSLVLDVVGNRE